MRRSLSVIVLALLATGSAPAQQSGVDVCGMAERHYAAIRAGDSETVISHHLPEFTFFMGDGGLLWPFRSLDDQRAGLMAADFSARTSIRHCRAQVYGDTGIATYYLVGSVTTGSKTETGTWRVSEVWVRQGSEWKEAHHHESPLLGSVHP